MKTLYAYLASLLAFSTSSNAQINVGSLAPDWTYKDINNNTHHLYEYLDSGYTVIIDVSATWCGPCWAFHNTHVADTLTAHYGPKGTINPKKIKFIFFEADDNTTSADLNGNTTATQGNWIAGTNYPIIDTTGIKAPYFVTGFPTYFVICPNKRVIWTGVGGGSGNESFWTNLMNNCPAPAAAKDASLISDESFVNVCNNTVFLQNMSTQPLSSATVKLYNGTSLAASQPWTGNLTTFGLASITFPSSAYTNGSGQLRYKVEVTGDNNAVNDSVKSNYSFYTLSAGKLKIEVHTDNLPQEINWELLDGSTIIDKKTYASNEKQMLYTYNYTIASGACVRFTLNDFYGDGITSGTSFTTNDDGYVKIYDGANNMLLATIAGNSFTWQTALHLKAGGISDVVNLSEENELHIYPNPANQVVNIMLRGQTYDLHILNMTGRSVYAAAAVKDQLSIPTGSIAAGLYIAMIYTEAGVITRRFEVVK